MYPLRLLPVGWIFDFTSLCVRCLRKPGAAFPSRTIRVTSLPCPRQRSPLSRLTVLITLFPFQDHDIGAFLQRLFQCGRKWPEVPSPLSVSTVKELLDTYVNVLGSDKIVKPDDLRGDYPSLQAALQDKGADAFWPDVDSVRGKFFIIPGGAGPSYCEPQCGVVLQQVRSVRWKQCVTALLLT